MKLDNLTNREFGRLKVIGSAPTRITPKGVKHRYWTCQCSCENKTIIEVSATHLKTGHTTSCGCFAREDRKRRATTHGKSDSRLWNIWSCMKARCYNFNHSEYKRYGARGITVCQEWLDSFENFHNWAIQNGYSDELTIDRINVDGNYEPTNCQWSTDIEQCNNKRNNVILSLAGQSKSIAEWARILDLPESLIRRRKRLGWDDEKILTTPNSHRR